MKRRSGRVIVCKTGDAEELLRTLSSHRSDCLMCLWGIFAAISISGPSARESTMTYDVDDVREQGLGAQLAAKFLLLAP